MAGTTGTLPPMPPVEVSVDGDITTITISRAERRNSLDSEAAGALADAVQRCHTRIMVLTGAGRAFCAGGDLEELERWTDLPEEAIAKTLYRSFQGVVRGLRQSDSIAIAAINGAAVGAGMDIALACDLRVAAESARLGQVWVRLGVIPGTGGAYLTQAHAGTGTAAELLLTGDLIDAQRALELGLVNSVVADDDLLDAVGALADRILRNPRDGVIANKRALAAVSAGVLEQALEHAAQVQPGRFTSDEFRTAVRAARKS